MERRAISPVIATVIIVAVTIAISIAVAGWLFGLFGGFTTTETLKIYPDSYINVNGSILVLHIKNTGGTSAEIYKININNKDFCVKTTNSGTITLNETVTATPFTLTPAETCNCTILLTSGQEATITFDFSGSGLALTAGVPYTVTLYTKAGNSYSVTVIGR